MVCPPPPPHWNIVNSRRLRGQRLRCLKGYLQNTRQQRGAAGQPRGWVASASPGWASQTQPGWPRTLFRWPRRPGMGKWDQWWEQHGQHMSNVSDMIDDTLNMGKRSLGSAKLEWPPLFLWSIWLARATMLSISWGCHAYGLILAWYPLECTVWQLRLRRPIPPCVRLIWW